MRNSFIFFIIIILSKIAIANVKLFNDLPEDFYTSLHNENGNTKLALCVDNQGNHETCNDTKKNEFFFEKENNYYFLKSKNNKCIMLSNSGAKPQKCKDNDKFKYEVEIIGQGPGYQKDGGRLTFLSFIIKQKSSSNYLGFKHNGPWNGYVKTKNTNNAVVFNALSDIDEFNPCLKDSTNDEIIFFCSCDNTKGYVAPGKEHFLDVYKDIIDNINEKEIFKTKNRNNIGVSQSYCKVALKTYRKILKPQNINLEIIDENSELTNVQKLIDLYNEDILDEDQFNEALEKILTSDEKFLKLLELYNDNILSLESFNEARNKILEKYLNGNKIVNNTNKNKNNEKKEEVTNNDDIFNQTYLTKLTIEKLSPYFDDNRVKVGDIIDAEIAFDNGKDVKINLILNEDFDSYFFKIRKPELIRSLSNRFKIKTKVQIASGNSCTYRSLWEGIISNNKFNGWMELRCLSDNLGDIQLLKANFSN